MSRNGHAVVRVDYDGTGESIGDDGAPGRVTAWMESIRAAVDCLDALPWVTGVGVIGVRMGGTLAAAVSQDRPLRTLVLWEPCLSGAVYTREMAILAAGTRTALGLAAPDESAGIDAAGYLITPQTIEDLAELRVDRVKPLGSPDVLLVSRDDRPPPRGLATPFEEAQCSTCHERLPGHKEMMVYPLRSRPPTEIFSRIVGWAEERSADAPVPPGGDGVGAGAGPMPPGPEITDAAVHEGVAHRAFRFGPGDRLFGVVTEPEPRQASRLSILLLAGGIAPRTTVNRMYFGLARDLAARGHRVLRLDVSGIGESEPASGEPPNNAYPPSLKADVAAAARVLTGGSGEALWVVGLCSGAYAAFQHALADERVVGVTLINPVVYYPRPGLAYTNEFGSGPKRPGKARRGWERAVSYLPSGVGWVDRRLRGRRLPRDIVRLEQRGVQLSIAFSKGDQGLEALARELDADVDRLVASGVDLQVFEGADHTFNPLEPRRKLLEWILHSIDKNVASAPVASVASG